MSNKIRRSGPIVRRLRSFLLGRKYVEEQSALRYSKLLSARDQPPPKFPPFDAQKLSDNYYCDRSGTQQVKPPVVLWKGSTVKSISDASKEKKPVQEEWTSKSNEKKRSVTPGSNWDWD